jgi:hypothetical protein
MGSANFSLMALNSARSATASRAPLLVGQGLLLQVPHRVSRGQVGLAVELGLHPRHDPEQGALSRPVQAQDPDLRPVEVGQGDVLDDRLLVVELVHPDHRVDDLLALVAHGVSLRLTDLRDKGPSSGTFVSETPILPSPSLAVTE